MSTTTYAEKIAQIRGYLEGAKATTDAINVDGVMNFLATFSGSTLPGLKTLTVERLMKENTDKALGLPEGVARAVVMEFLREKPVGGRGQGFGRRMFRVDFLQMSHADLVDAFAKDPFNPQSLAGQVLRARVHKNPCVVFINDTDQVDCDATSTLVEARVQGRPVTALFNGRPIFSVGERPNEMVELDPIGGAELTIDGKDQVFGLMWIAVDEETRSFILWLVAEGHVTAKGMKRAEAAKLFGDAKAGIEQLSAIHIGETELMNFRILQSAGNAPKTKVLRAQLRLGRKGNLKNGLQTAVTGLK